VQPFGDALELVVEIGSATTFRLGVRERGQDEKVSEAGRERERDYQRERDIVIERRTIKGRVTEREKGRERERKRKKKERCSPDDPQKVASSLFYTKETHVSLREYVCGKSRRRREGKKERFRDGKLFKTVGTL
jgi:hypothetical protein